MLASMAKTAAATAAYCVAHSLLATDGARRAAGRLVGERRRDAAYRAFYNVQAAAGLWALRAYVRRLPDRELYRARGPAALAMRGGQLAALAGMGWAAWHVGPLRLSGLDGLGAWVAGADRVPPAAVGQGPSRREDGSLRITGPFRHARHPLNLAAPAVLWLQPRMTANLLAFNAVATAYFVLGSRSEEARLRAAFGRPYAEYQASGVPFYLPRSGPAPIGEGERSAGALARSG